VTRTGTPARGRRTNALRASTAIGARPRSGRAHGANIGLNVALAATLHDATGALCAMIRRRLPALRRLYAAIAVTTSPPTHPSVNALLTELGIYAGTPRSNARGPLYRLALRRVLSTGAARVHYLDFDRALHWVATRPRELAAVLRLTEYHPALVVGRTVAAHRSHHRPLFETERVLNARFAARFGLEGRVDFLVPSFVLTRALAAALVRRSRARDAAVYGEWPALLATAGAPLAYLECRGLDWETPDRHRVEVQRIGLTAWRRTLDSRAEWDARRALAADIARGFDAAIGDRVSSALSRLRVGAADDRRHDRIGR
jgi:hypothetical protein